MSTHHRWIAAALASSALAVLSACATTPAPAAPAVAPASAAATPTQRVFVTGSRLAVPVEPRSGQPETALPMQVVTDDDLDKSARVDLASSLRELVPAMH